MNLAELPSDSRARVSERETLIAGFDTDPKALRALLPWSLAADGSNTALAEFAASPDPAGGSRTEFNLLIPALYGTERVLYCAYMAGDDVDRSRGRARLVIVHDTLTGILELHGRPIAIAAMNYRRADLLEARRRFAALSPADTLRQLRPQRVAAFADGGLRLARARLVAQPWSDIRVQRAWTGPASLDLLWPANSPLAALSVRAVHGGLHCVIDFQPQSARPLVAAQAVPAVEAVRQVPMVAVEGGMQ
jgi:acetoacetate decarboxylase